MARRRDSGHRWQAGRFTAGTDLAGVDVDTSHVRKMFDVTDQAFNLGASRVLNRSLMRARTQATREISNQLAVKPQRLIRVRMRIDRASSGHLAGRLRMLDNPMSMSRLVLRTVGTTAASIISDLGKLGFGKGGGGVFVAGHGLQADAFIAKKRGTSTYQVFRRKTRKRLPLEALKIVVSLVARDAIRTAVVAQNARAASDLEAEMQFRVNYASPGSYQLKDRQAAVADARARMGA